MQDVSCSDNVYLKGIELFCFSLGEQISLYDNVRSHVYFTFSLDLTFQKYVILTKVCGSIDYAVSKVHIIKEIMVTTSIIPSKNLFKINIDTYLEIRGCIKETSDLNFSLKGRIGDFFQTFFFCYAG